MVEAGELQDSEAADNSPTCCLTRTLGLLFMEARCNDSLMKRNLRNQEFG